MGGNQLKKVPLMPRHSSSKVWRIVGITSLPPGWRNIYVDKGEVIEEHCPAILVQDLIGILRSGPEGKERMEELPAYETRCVFAGNGEEKGMLVPVDEMDNYECTLAPEEQYEKKE